MNTEIKKKIEKIAYDRYADHDLSGNPLIYGKRIGFVDGYEYAEKQRSEEQAGEETDKWIPVIELIEYHLFVETKYSKVIEELQSKFILKNRPQ